MPDRPDGVHLLGLARAALLEDLSAALPEEHRYSARLVAKAMAIAAREMKAGDLGRRAERDGLESLFGDPAGESDAAIAAESLGEALERLNWRLAAEIRSGGRDADARVHALLGQSVDARLKIVNPRAFGAAG